MSFIGSDELVFNKNDEFYGGGFSVDSIMMRHGISPIVTLNGQKGGTSNGNVSSIFEGLAVPSYAYYNNFQSGGKPNNYNKYDSDSDEEENIVGEDLHDKLLGLVTEHDNNTKNNRKGTKRAINKKDNNKKNISKKKSKK